MLHQKDGPSEMIDDPAFHNLGRDDALLAIETGGGFVDEVDPGRGPETEDDGEALHLSPREGLHPEVGEGVDVEGLDDEESEESVAEGRVDVPLHNFLDGSRKFAHLGAGGLHLVGDSEGGKTGVDPVLDLGGSVATDGGLLSALLLAASGEELHEGGLSRSVLAHETNDLAVTKVSGLNFEGERGFDLAVDFLGEGLAHVGILDEAQFFGG
mmetsp:Transcript_22091/g.50482  ORF Transcript_22091/g.50482 Transcript_22091/m.50482 type:complete len:212 (-) Transcript_22091:1349-1984(-)